MANAVKGLKNVIQHRHQFIKGLDDISKDWRFAKDPSESIRREKDGVDKFVQESLNRLIDTGLDPRK